MLVAIVSIAIVGCGGGAGSDTTSGSGAVATTNGEVATTLGAPATTVPPGSSEPTVPAGFPVEIMTGGTIQSSYPTEITVVYPESSYDSLIAFYDEWTTGRDVVANDMFPSGREWQIQEQPLIQIQVTVEEQGAVLFARVLP
jgi:hypothetical protein